ncbi:MAG TPA: hypothetical protein VM367_09955 [Pseudonocardia sp.]|jgi:hypothetical protein|nr:hypothetical protein [Pseudonocardia sp.]
MSDSGYVEDGGVGVDEPGTEAPTGTEEAAPVEYHDVDGDGQVDTVVFELAPGVQAGLIDYDADGGFDELHVDTDGDGLVDMILAEDAQGGYVVGFDADGDGEFETQTPMTLEQVQAEFPGIVEYLDLTVVDMTGEPADPSTDPYVVDGQVVGDPAEVSEHWFHQAQNGFCVPASIAQIVSEYSGVDYTDEQAFVELANQIGVWSVGPDGVPGITIDGTLQLLEAAGVPAHVEYGGSMESLADALGDGQSVIVFVDADEVWYGPEAGDGDAEFDHALVMAGIDTERGVVLLSDPGDPEGDLREIPIDRFMDAWADSDHTAVVADSPSPNLLPDEPAPAEGDPDAAAADRIGAAISTAIERPWVLLAVTLDLAAE